jgi:hypothetical protein
MKAFSTPQASMQSRMFSEFSPDSEPERWVCASKTLSRFWITGPTVRAPSWSVMLCLLRSGLLDSSVLLSLPSLLSAHHQDGTVGVPDAMLLETLPSRARFKGPRPGCQQR